VFLHWQVTGGPQAPPPGLRKSLWRRLRIALPDKLGVIG